MTKRIVLCADDYGQALAISQGIVALVQQARLSAVSCMVNSPVWLEHAKWLLPYRQQIDIGLHFNLTEGEALSELYIGTYGKQLPSLPVLLRKAMLRQLNQAALEAECQAQIERFVQACGFFPRFIDGHQHVHQFPVIRDALIRVYEQTLRPQVAYVRLANDQIKPIDLIKDIKKVIIYAAGARAFARLLKQHHIPYNQSFTGVYDFANAANYQQIFPQFLRKIGDGGLIMCHPAFASSDLKDEIAEARYEEYQYLASPKFLEDCETAGVRLSK